MSGAINERVLSRWGAPRASIGTAPAAAPGAGAFSTPMTSPNSLQNASPKASTSPDIATTSCLTDCALIHTWK